MAGDKRRVWKASGRAKAKPSPAVSRVRDVRVWTPQDGYNGVVVPPFGASVTQPDLDKHLAGMRRDNATLNRVAKVLDLELVAFPCGEPISCVGMVVDGKMVHHHTCTWWWRSHNKKKTPF